MDLEQYKRSLAATSPPDGTTPLLEALWHDAHGDWQRAHRIVQEQAGVEACAVHAYLHRKEGDLANADYWYQRANKQRTDESLSAEWTELVTRQLARE